MKSNSDTENRAGGGCSSRALLGIAAMCAAAGVTHIGDTEDMESKKDAFDEWMEDKWKAIRVTELKRGDKMRDAAGGAIEVTGAFYASADSIYVQCGSLSMTIPQNGVVLILPNDQAHSQKGRERGPDNTQD
jgi:hypothetical protein